MGWTFKTPGIDQQRLGEGRRQRRAYELAAWAHDHGRDPTFMWMRRLALALRALGVGLLVYDGLYFWDLRGRRPSTSDPARGLIYPLKDKGTVVYISGSEHALLTGAFLTGIGLIVVALLVEIIRRKQFAYPKERP